MAQNKVEYHIQDGGIFTFKVKAGATVKIGQLVEITGDREVAVPAGLSTKLVGVVYSGTVGIDGVGTGYKGDNGDVVSVVLLKPLVYLTAGDAVTAGAKVSSNASGQAVATGATDANKVAFAITGATAGNPFLAALV